MQNPCKVALLWIIWWVCGNGLGRVRGPSTRSPIQAHAPSLSKSYGPTWIALYPGFGFCAPSQKTKQNP